MQGDGRNWRAKISDKDFIDQFESIGPVQLAEKLGINVRGLFGRRTRIEQRIGRQLVAPGGVGNKRGTRQGISHPGRINLKIKDGIVLVGSDCHYWNIEPSTAHRAFVKFVKKYQPAAVIMNGDVLDGATISRHPPINWEERPSLIQEIEACQERLGEIEKAIKTSRTRRIWTLGNHDARFETRLATVAPEFARVHGLHLRDHFPEFEPCWMVCINDDVVIKHRYKGGVHARHNNTLWSGKTIVTGHLHNLGVTPFNDYGPRTRWGVDSGTMADPYGPQFEYTESNPLNWRSGFVVLTFKNGNLLWPEVFHVIEEGLGEFRGETIEI